MKTVQFQGLRIRVDRPKGFVQEGKDEQGKPWKRVYKYDYGFLPKTDGGDGDGIDVFLGPSESAHETYWVFQKKPDGTFDEWKVMLGFGSKSAAVAAYDAHIPKRFRGQVIALPIGMMKAMLNLPPGLEKAAGLLGFLDELAQISVATGQVSQVPFSQ